MKSPLNLKLPSRLITRLCVPGFLALAAVNVNAQHLTNANFEVEPLGLDAAADTFPGWTEGAGTAATVAPVAISDNYSAKLTFVTAGNLVQNLVDANNELSQWDLAFDFACNDPGSATTRSFNPNFRHTASGFNQINLRVVQGSTPGKGTVQIFNNSSWVSVLTDAVTFSAADTDLSVNHMRLVGHYSDATPTYDLFLTNGLSEGFSAEGLAHFHGTKPTAGTTLRSLSFESGNYTGGAFSVVDNVSVTSFGTVNNAPVITSDPTSRTVLEGAANVTISAGISGTPPLYAQWRFNGTHIENATNATLNLSTLVLTNVTTSDAGEYSLFVTNAFGTALSAPALLTVIPAKNTAQMTNIWDLLPGDRDYLASSGNTERSIAYNPVTDSLLIASRAGGSNTIAVLDAATGAEKHLMNLVGVFGGTLPISMIGVGDDGAVYGANLVTAADDITQQFRLYRWDDDSANSSPIEVFIADPAAGAEPGLRWGDTLAVRGAGAQTEVLIAPNTGTNLVLLRPGAGYFWDAVVISISGVPTDFARNSIAFGEGNTFWSKGWGGSLRLIEYDLNANTGSVAASYNNTVLPRIQTEVVTIGMDPENQFLAALALESPDNVRLYSVADLVGGPVLRDQELFTTDNPNPTINGTGSAVFGGNYLFVLNSNNGIKAFEIDPNYAPTLDPFDITGIELQSGSQVIITWESVPGHTYQVQYKTELKDAQWLNLGSAITATAPVTSVTNVVEPGNRFFRVLGN